VYSFGIIHKIGEVDMVSKIFNIVGIIFISFTFLASVITWFTVLAGGDINALGATAISFVIIIYGVFLSLIFFAIGFALKYLQQTSENTEKIYNLLSKQNNL
jgi:hypothetical protein